MSLISPANLGGVADPRLSMEPDAIGSKKLSVVSANIPGRRSDKLHDPSITFEEYHHYANKTRENEKHLPAGTSTTVISMMSRVKIAKKEREADFERRTSVVPENLPAIDEKMVTSDVSPPAVSDEEWRVASRAARTATWGAVFYLITTDILGPFSVPWAIAQLGYGPGFALYTVFGALAGVSGYLLWQQFLGLDSDEYPIKNYADIGFRLLGTWMRHICNILASFQFFLGVTLLIVGNGQGLAQMAQGANGNGFLCFVVAQVIFMLLGFILGQIRTLQRFSYLANFAIWLNVFIIFMTMGVASGSTPNYAASALLNETPAMPPYPPVSHTAGIPDGKELIDNINGLMQAVYSYGGATLFCELMAEMRRPADFWKGLFLANFFIFACYIIYGMVVYSQQGQYTYNPAYQGLNPYAWQTVGNTFSLVSGLIAAVLYGNIGIKVFYANVGRELLKFPALEEKKGKWLWVAIVPIYWGLAFVIGAAVPQLSYLSAFVGAATILQFTYTFPPLFALVYNIRKDAMVETEKFDPLTGTVQHQDSGIKRILRGFAKKWYLNIFYIIYFLGAATTAVLGIYSSVISMHHLFATTPITPFGCANPAG